MAIKIDPNLGFSHCEAIVQTTATPLSDTSFVDQTSLIIHTWNDFCPSIHA